MTADGRRRNARNFVAGKGNPHWEKGKSQNPGGRPKADKVMRQMIASETCNGRELAAYALGVMRSTNTVKLKDDTVYKFTDLPTDGKSRNYAHDWLTVRVAGKAPLVVTVEAHESDAESPVNFDALTDAQLEALEALDRASEPKPDVPDEDAVPAADGQN